MVNYCIIILSLDKNNSYRLKFSFSLGKYIPMVSAAL